MSAVRILAGTCLACLLTCARAGAQTQGLDHNPLPDLFSALMTLSLSQEVSTGFFRIDNNTDQSDDTLFRTLRVPWRRDLDAGLSFGELHVEAALGILLAKDRLEIDSPFGRASLDQDWLVAGGQAGLGLRTPVAWGWFLEPSAAVGFAYMRNDADYNAAGELVIKPLVDGTLVDWDAWAIHGEAALAIERPRDLKQFSWGLSARHVWGETDIVRTSSSFQEGSDSARVASARGEFGGPSSLTLAGESIDWSLGAGWFEFLDVDRASLGFDSFGQLGGSVTLRPDPKAPRLRFGASLVLGEDIQGWSAGLSIAR